MIVAFSNLAERIKVSGGGNKSQEKEMQLASFSICLSLHLCCEAAVLGNGA